MQQTKNTPSTGNIQKYELALRYFPKATSKKQATDSLTRWINRCKPLSAAMARIHYRTTEKSYTPKQVQLIYEYLGEP